MTRNLKALGVALMAVFAMSAVAAQGAAGHEFHADGEKAISTGTNDLVVSDGGGTKTELSVHEFTVGTAGVVKCNKLETESTQKGTLVSANTYKSDELTVTPRYTECTFGGNPATVDFEHCAYKFDSDTTLGNTTGNEHANVEIECEAGSSIKIVTSVCTLTVGAQLIKHAVRYVNDPHSVNAINVISTAHAVVVGNLNDKGGCVLIPKGAVGKYIGTATASCSRDDGTELTGTTKTTPKGLTTEGPATECKLGPN